MQWNILIRKLRRWNGKLMADKVLITKNDETVEGEYSDGTISMDADGMYLL